MKNNFLLLFCLYFFLSTNTFAHSPTDSIEVAMQTRLAKLYTEWGTKQLEALIAQNATNDAKGESFKNSYIIDFEQALATEPTCAEYVKNYTPNTWASAPYEHFTSKQELETFLQKYNTELYTTKGTGTHIYFGYNLFLGRIITTSFIETLSSDGLKIEGGTKKDFQAVRTNFDAILSNIKQAVCPADNKWVIITYGRWRENLSQSGDEFGYGHWKTEKATTVSTVSNIDLGFARIGVSNLAKDDLLGKAKLAFDAVRDALTGENLLGAASKFINMEAKNYPAFYNTNRDKILEAAGLINDLGVEFDSLQVYCTQNPSKATDLGFCIGTGIGDIASIDKLILTLKSRIRTRNDLNSSCPFYYVDIKEYLEVLPNGLMQNLSLAARTCALRKSSENNIYGDLWGLGLAQEPMIIKLINTTPINQSNGLLNNLIAPSNNISGKSLLTKIINGVHDGFGNNYGDLIRAITEVVGNSSDEKYGLPQMPSLANYIGKTKQEFDAVLKQYNSRIINWGGSDGEYISRTGQLIRIYDPEWLEDEFRYTQFGFNLNDNGTIHFQGTKKKLTAVIDNTKTHEIEAISIPAQDINPFTLIYFTNNTDFVLNGGLTGNVVPAIFLIYAKDKGFNQTSVKAAVSTLDILTIFTGPPKFSIAYKAALGAYDVGKFVIYAKFAIDAATYGGAIANLALNAADIRDEQMRGWVDTYNATIGVLSLPYIVNGILKFGTKPPRSKFGPGTASELRSVGVNATELAAKLKSEDKVLLVIWYEKLKKLNGLKDGTLLEEAKQMAQIVQEGDATTYGKALAKLGDYELAKEVGKGYVLRVVGTGVRFIAKTGAELRSYLKNIINKPIGVTYNGGANRTIGLTYNNPLDIHPGAIAADYRYNRPTETGLYLSETYSGNITEMSHYSSNGIITKAKTYTYANIEVSDMLDLTNQTVRDKLAVDFEGLTRNLGDDKVFNYEFTHEIGTWAKDNYKGLIVPGARGTKDYKNIIIFKQVNVDAVFTGKTPTIIIHD